MRIHNVFSWRNKKNICTARLKSTLWFGQPWLLSWMHIRLVIWRLRVRPLPGLQHSFVETDHEIFSTVVLSLSLIQERQLSVSGKRMCTVLVKCLED